MKSLSVIILFVLPFALLSQVSIKQEITKDSTYLETVVIDTMTYFRQCRIIEYEGGGFDHSCSPELIDSATLIQRIFRDAHQVMRPVAQARKVLSIIGQYRGAFNGASTLLNTISGENYFDFSQNRYGQTVEKRAWKLRIDGVVAFDLYSFRNQSGDFVIRQSTIVFNNQAKTFTRSITANGYTSRVLMYDNDYIRLTNLDGNTFVEFVKYEITDDDGRGSGRFVWRDLDGKYVLTQFEHTEEQ